MKGDWKECRLYEVADVQTGPFGSQLHQSDYKLLGTPIITVEHLGDNRIVHNNLPLVSDADKERLKKYTLMTGDVVFSRVGSVDRCAYIHESENGWMFSGRLLRVRAKKEFIDSRFISFYFSQESFKETIRMIAVGATMPSINTEILSNIDITIPPLPEQKAIASVLSSLDDKIDLLHRQNKTLEGMAEALWRKMFVEASEVSIIKLGDIIEIYDNKRIPLSSMVRDKMKTGILYPYYGAATIMDYINDYIFDCEYLLMGEDGSVQTDEGYPILQLATGKYWVNNHTHVLEARRPFSNFLLYIILKNTSITHIVTGAVQPKINQENLKSLEIEIPKSDKIEDVAIIVEELWDKIKLNNKQIHSLSKFRDSLLPKLMSGEVRVKL